PFSSGQGRDHSGIGRREASGQNTDRLYGRRLCRQHSLRHDAGHYDLHQRRRVRPRVSRGGKSNLSLPPSLTAGLIKKTSSFEKNTRKFLPVLRSIGRSVIDNRKRSILWLCSV